MSSCELFFFFQEEDGIRDDLVTGVQTCALPIYLRAPDSSYGALLTSIGLGAALGSLGLARLSAPRFRPALFATSLVGSGISLAVMAATSSVTVPIASGFFVRASRAVFLSRALALI